MIKRCSVNRENNIRNDCVRTQVTMKMGVFFNGCSNIE